MELTIIGLIVAGLAALLFYDDFTQGAHARRTLNAWQQAGRTVQIPPVSLIYHSDNLPPGSPDRILGAVGAADDQLIFTGQRDSSGDFTVPLDALTWIGVATDLKVTWNRRIETHTAILHIEQDGTTRIASFTQGRPGPLARRLADQVSAQTGLPIHAAETVPADTDLEENQEENDIL